MDEILDSLWVEKWRPKELSDVVMEEKHKTLLEKCLYNNEIPQLLFLGCPGSGKSTIARILCDKIIKNDMDLYCINGSDESGVTHMRENVLEFLKIPPMSSKHKIIFIDEADGLSIASQRILRNAMERFAENGRFIFTANYKSKIEPALISRFQVIEMKKLSNEYIFNYCKKILDNEQVKFKEEDVKLIIESLSPDVRKIVNVLQQSTDNKEVKNIDKNSIIGIEKKIIGLICQICDVIGTETQNSIIDRNISDIQQTLSENPDMDYLSIYDDLFNHENIPMWAKIPINEYCNKHNSSAIPNIHFTSMVWNIISNGMNYVKTFGMKK